MLKRTALKKKPNKLKRSRISKIPKLSISKLKKQCDTIYSRYRRLSMATDGICTCITCGKKLPWKKIQNGHYVHRRISSTRYYDKNNHPQCMGCNLFGNGKLDIYAIKLIELYGSNILQHLNYLRNTTKQFKEYELLEMIDDYTKGFKELDESTPST